MATCSVDGGAEAPIDRPGAQAASSPPGAGFRTRSEREENMPSGVSKSTHFTCIKECGLPLENRHQTQHSGGRTGYVSLGRSHSLEMRHKTSHHLLPPVHLPVHPLTCTQIIHPSTFPSIHPPTHPSIYSPIHHPSTFPSIQPPTHPSTHSSIHPSIILPFTHPPTHPPIHPAIHPPAHPSIHPLIHPSFHSPTHPPFHPPTHPSIHPPIIYPSNIHLSI